MTPPVILLLGSVTLGVAARLTFDLGAEARDFVDVSGLELAEDVSGTVGDATWHTPRRATWIPKLCSLPPADELAKEEHAPVDLAGGDVVVLHALETPLEVIEFVVVRSKEGLGAPVGIVVQVLDDSPSDRDTIVGAGTTAQLVEEDEGAGREGIEDARGFLHLDHEGRFATGDIVRGSDTGEDAIGEPEVCGFGWDEGADLRQKHDEGGLTKEGGLTAHVRPR